MNLKIRIATLLLAVMFVSILPACEMKPDTPKDSHLDWVYILSTRNKGAVTENGYYYVDNEVLNYTDFATEKSAVLCAKPGCAHKPHDEENPCDAEMPFKGDQMFFENNTLYYLGDENILCSRDATGGSLKELGTIATELTKAGKSVSTSPLALCNGYLYYEGNINESVRNPSGGSSSTTSGYCIGRFNIAQRKDEMLVLLEDAKYIESIKLYAARENGVIYLYKEGLDPEQDWDKVDTKKRLEAQRKMPIHIKHLNLVTGETTTILTATHGDVSYIGDVDNGKLYYRKSLNDGNYNCEIHSYDLVTGKDTVVFTDISPTSLGGGYWLSTKHIDAKTAERHIYDMNTGKTLPYELKEHFWIMNRSEYGLVVLNYITGVYSLLSFDSLADGLQEADLKYLYAMS